MPRRTALIVPVREAAPYYDRQDGVPAHVTVLFPFVDPEHVDERDVRETLGRFPAFEFVLDRLESFDSGVRYLHPSPSAPFADLTAAVWQRWPDHPPYEGAHEEVVPHLTVTAVDVALPIRCRATEVLLIEEEREEPGSRWAARLQIPLR